MAHPLQSATWLREPPTARVDGASVAFTTAPNTDFWQRTYYGFRNDNAPALLLEVAGNDALTVRATFDYRRRFDQAGLLLYLDSENWAKAAIEFEDEEVSRLGSVVTNGGYSDWATRDIPTPRRMWYRLSRRGPYFLLEAGTDGTHWEQLRIFHLRALGETTAGMGAAAARELPAAPVRMGVYACSPEDSSFEARFDRISIAPSDWPPHA